MPIDPLSTNQIEVIRGPGSPALRVDIDRRRGQRHQQSHSGCVAGLRRGAVSNLWTSGEGAAGKCRVSRSCVTAETRTAVSSVDRGGEGGILLDAGGGNFAIHADAYGRKSGDYNIPSYPYLFDPGQTIQRTPAEFRRAGRRRIDRRLLFLPWRFHRCGDHADRCALSYPRSSTAPIIRPASTRIKPKPPPRANTAPMRRRSMPCGSGPAQPTTSTTKSGWPTLTISTTLGVRQSFTNKEQEGRVEVQFAPFNARFAAVTTAFGVAGGASGTDGAKPGRYPGSLFNGLVGPEQTTRSVAGYIFNELKFTETDQGADCRAHRACQSSADRCRFHSGGVRPQRRSQRHRPSYTAQSVNFTPKSGSVGLIQNLPWDLVGSMTGAICRARAKTRRTVLARRA